MFIAEAPGQEEEKLGRPLVGPSGSEFDLQLEDVGIRRSECSVTNVFNERPPGNRLEAWKAKKASGASPLKPSRTLSCQGGLIDSSRVSEALSRLRDEILLAKPNVIVALGNTALEALTRRKGIGHLRGSLHSESLSGLSLKVLPTYHPSAVLHQYEIRPTVLQDLG